MSAAVFAYRKPLAEPSGSKKAYADDEKAIEVAFLHLQESERLSEGEAKAMPHLAAYGNLR